MHDRRQGEPAHHILRVQWCRARNPGAGRRCHELRSRRGVAGWSAVPLTEHAETARPAVDTAQVGCLACTHRRPGRRPRPPRGGRDCRIAREGMGVVFLCFWLAPKKSISTRRWIPTRCERVWYSKQGTNKLNASITCWASGCGKTQPEGEVPRKSGSPSRQSPVLAAPHSHAGIPTQYRKAQCLVRLRICAAWTKTVSGFVPGGGV